MTIYEIETIKSALHHWWPKSVSKRWFNKDGIIHQLSWDGRDIPQTNAKNFGAIRNAHLIKFSSKPTVWDQSFEDIFQSADDAFPDVLNWVESLQIRNLDNISVVPQEQNMDILLECVLSLVVRSPRFRNQIKHNVGFFNKNVDEKLINLNQRDALKRFTSSTFGGGKFAILFSSEQEFIFGDGFYHNFTSSVGSPSEPKIIVPILPNVCIFYIRPMSYKPHPRWVATEINKDKVDFINKTTMIYSRDFIFYKSQKPTITEDFSCRRFLEYEWNNHPMLYSLLEILK
jgi:hypothetical protein